MALLQLQPLHHIPGNRRVKEGQKEAHPIPYKDPLGKCQDTAFRLAPTQFYGHTDLGNILFQLACHPEKYQDSLTEGEGKNIY